MVKRPIVLVCLGCIIGIIYGLYFKSIALFFAFLIVIFFSFKQLNKQISRYVKIIFPIKAFLIFVIAFIISYFHITFLNQKYEEIYRISKEIDVTGIVENTESGKYTNKYILNLKTIDNKKYINTKLILRTKKNLGVGDYIKLKAEYIEPEEAKNYKGFSYKNYLKQENIAGTIKSTSEILVLGRGQINYVVNLSNKLKSLIKKESDANLGIKNSSIFVGILLGDKSDISKSTITEFKESSMMHILAVSGAHVSYVIMIFSLLLKKISKRKYAICLIMILVFFMILTEFTPSVVRACVMAIVVLFSKIIYEKSDTYTNMSLSCLILLLYNPYNILNIGFQLTFLGTLGIILISSKISKFIENKLKNRVDQKGKLCAKYKIINMLKKTILNAIIISFSVQIMIMPVIVTNFNMLTLNFIISGVVSIPIFAGIMIIGILAFVLFPIRFFIFKILNILINILAFLSHIISKISFLTFTVVTPNIFYLIIYYFVVSLFIIFSGKISIKIAKSKLKLRKLLKKIIVILLIISLIFQLVQIIIPKNLRIYFIDVGQGDSCLIITPSDKTILIDGGGSTDENYDIGEKLLVPYLLDRGVKVIDYMMVSHFDNDHCGGLMYVLEKLNVKNILISKQSKVSKEFEKFMDIVNKKKINTVYVQAGNIVTIEKDIKMYILYPFQELEFEDLNNNSIVAKLVYKSTSILFTGDIEKEAEKKIIDKYNRSTLKSTILKVPHHGSKTSSTEEFLALLQPKIALIGVGKDNNFGHPNDGVIERLETLRC